MGTAVLLLIGYRRAGYGSIMVKEVQDRESRACLRLFWRRLGGPVGIAILDLFLSERHRVQVVCFGWSCHGFLHTDGLSLWVMRVMVWNGYQLVFWGAGFSLVFSAACVPVP